MSATRLRLSGRRLWAEWGGLALVMALFLAALALLGAPFRADNLIYDYVAREKVRAVSARVMIVAIDDRSLRELGRWPWPRSVHAGMLDALAAARPAAVGYDVLFLEPSGDDAALAAAMARLGRVQLPVLVEVPGDNGAPSATELPVVAAHGLGHVILRPDTDGIVRRVVQFTDPDGRPWPFLMDQLLRREPLPLPPPGQALEVEREVMIPFAAGPGGFPAASFVDVLRGRVPPALLKDRILLVGATGAGLGDRFSTPRSAELETMPGVEVQANYLNALLTGGVIRVAGPGWLLLFTLLPTAFMMLAFLRLSPRANALIGALLLAGTLAVSVMLLWWGSLWLPPVAALVGVAIVWPVWGWRRLDLANRYMVSELRALGEEPKLLPAPPEQLAGDPVERQIQLMHAAIRDVRDLRLFVNQSLDSLPDAALVTDMSGVVRIANAAAERLWRGRMPGGPVDAPLAAAFAALGQNDAQAEMLLSAMAAGRLPPDAGYESRLSDGMTLEIRLAFFTDAARLPLGWIARFADITALRASERQREDALKLLTHDMRAPQASILAVLQSDAGAVPADVAARIGRYARQTLELADDFVNLARAESGKFAREPLNLSDVLTDAVDDLWPLSSAKGISVRMTLPEEELMVRGDRTLLTRMLTNLVGNAIKYSPANRRIECVARVDESGAMISIADQGIGVAAEHLPLLFEPFRRLTEAIPTSGVSQSGAGLGLAFVKAVAEGHGGRVWAESAEGAGSVFTVKLPLLP
ncbi:CHASE2 domain-containing protein [Sandaracinobacteroides saxicola]|uniref:histidine kinase n=1 Tax=Sandaracinobacteroides saxicola TaxID=2759707 RepID=A0A7G5IEV4_9SPHN|nr:CHASE2 domain-containing protein [Sandaracinobacteroides saxicola]QMW21896.1 CHASE2 domain-containing protein [Sandaracinobacteroides saxicola]